ncbi:hypothetical protein LguiB_025573 [Lonicera macranthoides]
MADYNRCEEYIVGQDHEANSKGNKYGGLMPKKKPLISKANQHDFGSGPYDSVTFSPCTPCAFSRVDARDEGDWSMHDGGRRDEEKECGSNTCTERHSERKVDDVGEVNWERLRDNERTKEGVE